MLETPFDLSEMTQSNPIPPAPLPQSDFGALASYHGPNGFHWLVRGWLGGMPRPGLFQPIEKDLASLRQMGVDVLVTLTDEWQPPVDKIEAEGIKSRYVAIPDMHPPSFEQAVATCAAVAGDLAEGRRVVYHCRGGKGRAGTLLACQLIWHGETGEEAIAHVKRRNRYWVESDSQMEFLHEFARRVREISA